MSAKGITLPSKQRKDLLRLLFNRELMLALFIVLFGAVASVLSPYFFNFENFKQVLIAISLDTVVVVGLTIVLVGGGIDLSVGSIIGFSAALIGLCFQNGVSIPFTVILALLAGLLVGIINGGLIAFVNINPLIMTLAMMGIARSGSYVISGGYALSSIPDEFTAFARSDVLGIPTLAVVALFCVLVGTLLLSNNLWLRKYYFIGGNEAAAYRAGIKVSWLKFISYIICGLFSALAAVMLVSRMGSTFPHSGLGTEIRVVSACIIGGCSINGGRGTITGAFLGVLLLGLISNILVLTGVSVYWQGIASGVILILAVLSDALLNRRKY
ncbi:MAG: ABC transporter permease [Chloroflexota bacterium]